MKYKSSFLSLIAFLMLVCNCANAQVNKDIVEQNSSDIIEIVAPAFPAFAIATNTTGKVLIEIFVDGSGKITSFKQISGHPLFKAELEKNVKLWKFKELSDEQKIRKFTLTFDFIIEKIDGEEEKQIISFKPPFEVKLVKLIPRKERTGIPHPPAIITESEKPIR